MTGTWYLVSLGAQGTHRGTPDGSSHVLTRCGRAFGAHEAVRLDLAPGESPPDPDQICRACRDAAR